MKAIKPLFILLMLFTTFTMSAQTHNITRGSAKQNKQQTTTTKKTTTPSTSKKTGTVTQKRSTTTTLQNRRQQPYSQGSSRQSTLSSTSSQSNKSRVIDNLVNNMVYVSGGTFTMGATPEQGSETSDAEKPTHTVTLSSYYIGRFEVTQEEWEAVMGSNPSEFKGAKRPVENVSWKDCQIFIRKLNAMTGMNFRLPTEAEWEFAARGGNSSRGYKYAGGNNIGTVAWYDGNSGSKTHNVGTKQPNELGLYDMSGNVWEWCNDWYGSYGSSSQTNPQGAAEDSYRVIRGNSWDSNARICRVSCRGGFDYDFCDIDFGFRLAL